MTIRYSIIPIGMILLASSGCEGDGVLQHHNPQAQSWDQGNLHSLAPAPLCPNAIYRAPNGELEECP